LQGLCGAAGAEEAAEHCAALFGESTFGDFDSMVEGGVVYYAKDRAAGTGFGVAGGKDQAGDAGVEDGSGAHGAGFEGAVEGAAAFGSEEAVVREGEAGGAERDDLGMSGWVVGAEDLVVATADDLAGGCDDDGADGDFAGGFRGVCFGDREAHEVFVSGHDLSLAEVLASFGGEAL